MKKAAIIALEHHERWDGKGYLKKQGEEISLEGRIVAIADVFDALTSKRSYKQAWSFADASKEIIRQSGAQFDPALVEIFQDNKEKFYDVYCQYSE